MTYTTTLVINDNVFPCEVNYLDNGRQGRVYPFPIYPRPDIELQSIIFKPNAFMTLDVLDGYSWLLDKDYLDGLLVEIEDHITASFNGALIDSHYANEVRYG